MKDAAQQEEPRGEAGAREPMRDTAAKAAPTCDRDPG